MTYSLDTLPPTPTPKDYHRIHFDTSALPPKRIVGLLACQRDPLLRSLRTKIISAREASLSAPPPPKGKQNKKKADNKPAQEEKVVSGKLWEVETEDTPIFPEGGGQPFDTGKMVVVDKNGGVRELVVEGCVRRGLEGVHLVRVGEGEAGLEGMEGEKVELRVDWERRVDHMSIHTSQHLLSAILDVHAEGLPTLSWSMSAYPSLEPPYIELPRALTWSEVEQVEKRCNEVIEVGKNIWVDVDMQGEDFVKTTAAGVRENRGIPTDYKDGVIRHINIDGIDRNACCGTQLPNTTYCQTLHIIPPSTPSTTTNITTKTPTKLYFTAGPRAFKYLSQSSRSLSLAAQVLNTSRNDLVDRLTKTEELRKDGATKERDLRGELSRILAGGAVERLEVDKGVVWVRRAEKASHDFDFLGLIVGGFQSGLTEGNVKVEGKVTEAVLVLTSAVAGNPTLLLVYSASNDVAKAVNERIKGVLEGDAGKGRVKGGGARGRYMSKVEGKWSKEDDERVKGILDEIRENGV